MKRDQFLLIHSEIFSTKLFKNFFLFFLFFEYQKSNKKLQRKDCYIERKTKQLQLQKAFVVLLRELL